MTNQERQHATTGRSGRFFLEIGMSAHTIKKIFYSLPELAFVLSLSESGIQELVRQGDLPHPRVLSTRRVGWLVREIEEWAENRPNSNLLPPANSGARKPRPRREVPDAAAGGQ